MAALNDVAELLQRIVALIDSQQLLLQVTSLQITELMRLQGEIRTRLEHCEARLYRLLRVTNVN